MRRPGTFAAAALSSWRRAPRRPGYRASGVAVPPAFRESRPTRATAPRPAGASRRARPTRSSPSRRPRGGRPARWIRRLLARAGRHDARPADRRAAAAPTSTSQAAAARVRGARAARSEARLDLAPTVTVGGGYTRQRLSSATFPIGERHLPRPGASGTADSTRRGSSICSDGCGGTCRRRARWSAPPPRICGTCRWRSRPSWRGPTSSCAARRSGSRSPAATRRTSAGRSR